MALNYNSPGFRDTLMILGAAGLVIPAFARFRITPVIGFILVGLLAGPFGLGAAARHWPTLRWLTISNQEAIAPFAEIGIILLLFSIGLELSFRKLWAMRKKLFGFGSAELVGAGLLIAVALMAFGESAAPALGLGLALSLSSTALVLPMSGTTSPVGRLALAMLLFEDIALVPIIFFLGVLVSGGNQADLTDLAATGGLGVLVVGTMLLAGPFLLPSLFAQAARTKSPELFLAAILLVVILSSLATTAVGLSPIVGALVAGLLIAETRYVGEVEALILPFKGLALGVFLITVGMSLDLTLIAARWGEILIAVAAVILIKAVVTSSLLRLGGVTRGVSAETGVLMASPSETTLIVLTAATQAGLIDHESAAFWTVVTAIGLTSTPILAKIGHSFARRIEHHMASNDQAALDVASQPRAILIGYGRVGQMVADMLEMHKRSYVAVESNVDLVADARQAGKPVRYGDAGRQATLDQLNVGEATAVIMTMDDPIQAVRMTKRLRERYPDLTIIARARDTDHAAELYRAGATDAVPETLESSLQLSEAVLVDLGVAMGPVIASIHEKRDELRAAIKEAGQLDDMPRLGPLKRQTPAQP